MTDMFNQNLNRNYGFANALADIVGTYIQKKSIDGALNYANNYENQLQEQSIKPLVDNTPMGSSIRQQTMQALMPNTDWKGSNPTADPAVLGLAKYLGQNTPSNQPTNLLSDLGSFQKLNPVNNVSKPQITQQDYDKQAAFDKTKNEHPEWFVGATYVGNDPEAKANAEQQQEKTKAAEAQLYQFNNPIEYTPPGQLSYAEYKQNVMKSKPAAMRELVSKYGMDAAKLAMPMIESTINDKMSTYADQQDLANRQQLSQYILGDLSTPQSKQRAMWALQEYNRAAKSMGKDGADMNLMGQMLASNDVAITAKDIGGSIQFYAAPKNGGAFADGTFIKPVFAETKSLSPDTAANLDERRFEFQNVSGNTKAQLAERRYEHTTPSANAVLGSKTQTSLAKLKSENSTNGNGQVSAAKQIINHHDQWMKNQGETDDKKDPNYNNYLRALQIIANAAGIAKAKTTINQDEANKVYDAIMSKYPNATDEEIKAYISQNYSVE